MSFIMRLAGRLVFNRPVRHHTTDQLAEELREHSETITNRIRNAEENPANHAVITHIIGIERWSQRRLKIALGEPMIDDEYNGYRPTIDTPWNDLLPLFEATRQTTIDLAESIGDVDNSRTIPHNAYGDLTVRGWLRYIDVHGNAESRKLRSAKT